MFASSFGAWVVLPLVATVVTNLVILESSRKERVLLAIGNLLLPFVQSLDNSCNATVLGVSFVMTLALTAVSATVDHNQALLAGKLALQGAAHAASLAMTVRFHHKGWKVVGT